MQERDEIEIVGASENNLKNISLTIPKEKLVVLAGVSGSGKSSLAFDTIAVESSRQWQATYPLFLRNRMPRYDRPAVDYIRNLAPSIVVNQKSIGANSRSTVGTYIDVAPLVRLLFSRVGKPSAGAATAYSFNHPLGMCPECSGLGERMRLDDSRLFDMDKSIQEGAILFSPFSFGSWQGWFYRNCPLLDPNKKLRDYSPEEWKNLTLGPDETLKMPWTSNNTGGVSMMEYEGVIPRFNRLYLNRDLSKQKKEVQDEVMNLIAKVPCSACRGTGLNPKALASRINGYNIADYYSMQVSDLLEVVGKIEDPVGSSIACQIQECLGHMVEVGLGYLHLGRRTDSLSGGENQRLKMVRHLGSSLSNIIYIFDEPTAGLHPEDAHRISRLLLSLRDKHNTVLVVEHSKDIIALADQVIELGPQAGRRGGEVVFQGPVEKLMAGDTLTAKCLAEPIAVNPSPKPWTESFLIEHATANNLKDVSVKIPKGVLTAVCGVAGSGKSSLICHEFAKQHPEAILINQQPISVSTRSTPATYTGIMDEIRQLFAKTNRVGAAWFSFNSKGACPFCKGKGEIAPDVAFADPVAILCEACGGKRYNDTALQYAYQGKNIVEVMSMTINQAIEFFQIPKIQERLQALQDVGLGYMTLGQSTASMSGGENQRLKLAGELHKQGNIYILDEPSSGLHPQDAKQLMRLLRQLTDQGNTVVMIEHRMELIAGADWIIELGPKGGSEGGRILFTGTPQELQGCEASVTRKYFPPKA